MSDAAWTLWSEWGSCVPKATKTCASTGSTDGTRTRVRTCNNPVTNANGGFAATDRTNGCAMVAAASVINGIYVHTDSQDCTPTPCKVGNAI
jgi:hypothetical protein